MQVIRVGESIDRVRKCSGNTGALCFSGQISALISFTQSGMERRKISAGYDGIAETRMEKVARGICGYFDFAAVLHYASGCSERDGCGLRAASEFRTTDVRQFGPN